MNPNWNKPRNDFQEWLITQGYYRNAETSWCWYKDGTIATGEELSDKLNEWKLINQ